MDCGARGDTERWNNGSFDMDSVEGESYFKAVEPRIYKRPATDVVRITRNGPHPYNVDFLRSTDNDI